MQTGIITEQGDLGLGFDPLSPDDQKVVNEAFGRDKENDKDKEDS